VDAQLRQIEARWVRGDPAAADEYLSVCERARVVPRLELLRSTTRWRTLASIAEAWVVPEPTPTLAPNDLHVPPAFHQARSLLEALGASDLVTFGQIQRGDFVTLVMAEPLEYGVTGGGLAPDPPLERASSLSRPPWSHREPVGQSLSRFLTAHFARKLFEDEALPRLRARWKATINPGFTTDPFLEAAARIAGPGERVALPCGDRDDLMSSFHQNGQTLVWHQRASQRLEVLGLTLEDLASTEAVLFEVTGAVFSILDRRGEDGAWTREDDRRAPKRGPKGRGRSGRPPKKAPGRSKKR